MYSSQNTFYIQYQLSHLMLKLRGEWKIFNSLGIYWRKSSRRLRFHIFRDIPGCRKLRPMWFKNRNFIWKAFWTLWLWIRFWSAGFFRIFSFALTWTCWKTNFVSSKKYKNPKESRIYGHQQDLPNSIQTLPAVSTWINKIYT